MESFPWGKIESKRKVIFFLFSMMATILLFYFVLLLPQWICIEQLTNQYNLAQNQLKVVESFALAHPNPKQYMIEMDRKLTQVDRMLPDNPDVSSFLKDIEQLSKQCGIQLIFIKPTQIIAKEGYREYNIELLIKGNYRQYMDFLNKSENGLRFTNVASVSMQVGKGGLESKLVAKIYSYNVLDIANGINTDTKKIVNK